jgi:hypothetical protein
VAGLSGYSFNLFRWSEPFWVNFGTPDAHLEQRRLDHTFTVPDGMWVMRQLYARQAESLVLGHPDSLNLGREYLRGWDDTLLFSPEPFAVIHVVYGEVPDGGPTGVPHGAYLHRARQVHKGELGQSIPVKLPLVARDLWPRGSNRDRKRGGGWVRLVDAAEMAGLSIERFVLDHWLFVEARDRSYYADPYKDVRIEMIRARDRETIHKQPVDRSRRLSFTKAEFEAILADNSTLWYEYWIRRGFARTVLLLQRYGWNKSKERLLLGKLQAA